MKISVLDRDAIGKDIDISCFEKFGNVTVHDRTVASDAVKNIGDADIAVTNKVRLSAEILAAAPNLKFIAEAATGVDNIDTAFCLEHGIGVANVPAYSTSSVAQVTVSLACMMMTKLDVFCDFCRSGEYTAAGLPNRLVPPFDEFDGKTWGIIGYGNIGKKVADIARVFGCRVIAYTRTPKADVECVELDRLLGESDIISVHCPLTDATRGLIGREEYSKMKKKPLLINVARGAVLDNDATVEAVLNGVLGGFASDVYDKEPFPADHPYVKIKDMKNVCFTPHIAWASVQARTRLVSEMEKNVAAFLNGEKRNRVV